MPAETLTALPLHIRRLICHTHMLDGSFLSQDVFILFFSLLVIFHDVKIFVAVVDFSLILFDSRFAWPFSNLDLNLNDFRNFMLLILNFFSHF